MCKQTTSKTTTAQTQFKPWCASCALKQNDRVFGAFETLSEVDQRLTLCFMEKQLEGLEKSYETKAAHYMGQNKTKVPTIKKKELGFKAVQKLAKRAGNAQKRSLGSDVMGYTIKELAQYISQKGVDIGRNQLYAWLRERDYVERASTHKKYLPTQEAINMEIMFIKKVPRIVVRGAESMIKEEPELRISQMGRSYFTALLLIENGRWS